MKAFLFITIFFLSFPLFYLGYQNLLSAGAFTNTKFTGLDGNNYEQVVFETSKFTFVEDNTTDSFVITSSDGQKINLPTSTGNGNIKNFFADWKRLSGDDGNQDILGSPAGCNYVNFMILIKTDSRKLSDNLERAYCTIKSEPNFTFIP